MANLADNIRLKRVYDEPSPEDGRRILITRYWPRGVPKSAVDEYNSRLAPSRGIINEYKKEELGWDEFGRRYRSELANPEAQAGLRRLADMATSQVITLLCFCKDDWNCHRKLLRDAIIVADSNRDKIVD
jgi:uncharacterized protein YeaO (DUF488 family)